MSRSHNLCFVKVISMVHYSGNPQRACTRVTVVVVCMSVCCHSSFHDAQQGGKRTIPMASLLQYLDFHTAVLMISFCLYSDILSAHLKFDLTSIKVVLTWPFMFIHVYI